MNRLSKILVATAAGAALSLAAAAASQAAVYVRIVTSAGTINSGALAEAPDGAFSFSATGNGSSSQLGGFNSIAITGSAPPQTSLHSESVETNASGPADATIYITRTNLNRAFSSLLSGFSYSAVGRNFTVTSSTIYDAGNGIFTGTQVGTASFTGTAAQSANSTYVAYNSGASPYSFTEKFIVHSTGGTSVQNAATLVGVPEPATWALMIGGFGAAGAMIRRRKAAVAA